MFLCVFADVLLECEVKEKRKKVKIPGQVSIERSAEEIYFHCR